MEVRISVLIMLIWGSADLFSLDLQNRLINNFFCKYEKHVCLLLRVREDVIHHLDDQVIQKKIVDYGELHDIYEKAHIKMLAGFEMVLKEYKQDAESNFYRPYLAQKTEQEEKIGDVESEPKNSFLTTGTVISRRSFFVELLKALFED